MKREEGTIATGWTGPGRRLKESERESVPVELYRIYRYSAIILHSPIPANFVAAPRSKQDGADISSGLCYE